MSEQTPDRRHGSPAQLALLAIGTAVLYILSPGPVGWFLRAANLMTIAPYIEAFYLPLKYLYDHIPLVKTLYDAYFTLFGLR